MALGKAVASLALGRSSAFVRERQKMGPEFVAQVQNFVGEQKMFMVGGGELIRDDAGNILGAVGVTGATEDEDEALVKHGIRAAGFKTDEDLAGLGPQIRSRPTEPRCNRIDLSPLAQPALILSASLAHRGRRLKRRRMTERGAAPDNGAALERREAQRPTSLAARTPEAATLGNGDIAVGRAWRAVEVRRQGYASQSVRLAPPGAPSPR